MKSLPTTTSKSRERQSLNRVFRAELHLDTGAYTYTSYGLNTAPSSLIGSKCVDVKGETSHPTLAEHIFVDRGRLRLPIQSHNKMYTSGWRSS